MKRNSGFLTSSSLALALLFLAACTGGAPTAIPQPPVEKATPLVRSEWDELVTAGQKEGLVRIYGTELTALAAPLRDSFTKKFGINLEYVTGRPPEVVAKITTERRAGLYMADVGHLGETTSVIDIKPLGITVPLPGLLVLPEVNDSRNWIGGQMPLLDKDKHVLMFTVSAFPQAVVNTEIVKEGEVSSYLDLLKPQWKGKIVFADPTISGGAPNQLAALHKAWGREKFMDFLKQLAGQEPVFTRDQRMLMEWVARAKYPIGLGWAGPMFTEFKAAGAPVKTVTFQEPRHLYAGPGNLVVFDRNPHPKATQVYVNWMLTKEGATVWSKALGLTSSRLDVSREHLDASFIPRTGDVFPDEEQLNLRLEMRKITAEVFAALLK